MTLQAALRPALTTVWLIVSAVLAVAVMAPFLAPAEVLYGVFSECEAKRRGSACALCGMTTAFVQISNGDLAGAQSSNSGSIALWSASSVNFGAAIAYSLRVLRRRRQTSEVH